MKKFWTILEPWVQGALVSFLIYVTAHKPDPWGFCCCFWCFNMWVLSVVRYAKGE